MIDRNMLAEAVGRATISSSDKAIIPGSDLAIVESVDGNISIRCSDGYTQCTSRAFSSGTGSFSVVVNAKHILNAAKSMPERDVEIGADTRGLTISCSRARVKIPKLIETPAAQYLVPQANAATIKYNELLRAIKTTIIHAEGNREINPVFDAIVVENSIARATDGGTAVLTKLDTDIGTFKMPLDSARKIAKLDLGDQRVIIACGKDPATQTDRCSISWGRGEFNFSPFMMTMPDFSNVFPAEHSDRQWIRVLCGELAKLADFGKRFAGDSEITLESGEGKITLTSNSGGVETSFSVESHNAGPMGFRCRINPNFMSNALESVARNDGIAILSQPTDSVLYLTDDLLNVRALVALIG